MNERNVKIDYIRALLILWIVGFWHYQGYCKIIRWDYQVLYNITYSVLGCFFFLSGFLLRFSVDDRKEYYKRKAIRVYFLLILSYVIGYIYNKVDGRLENEKQTAEINGAILMIIMWLHLGDSATETIINGVVGSIGLFFIGSTLSKLTIIYKGVYIISTASFCAYLFHRQNFM